jgi:transposase
LANLSPRELHDLVWCQAEETARLQATLAQRDETLARQDAHIQFIETKNQALILELAHLRRMRFGTKSEALNGEQRDLFQETLDGDLAAIEQEIDTAQAALQPEAPKPPRPRAGRQPIPSHLPRIEHRHEPESCTCGQCGQALVLIGEDVSEQLDVEPARFFVHRHIRPQYACRACETVTAAPVPAAVIDGGLAAPGLLAWVATSKFADHMPLYRIEQMAARQEVPLPRSTLAEWMGRLGVALAPLADRLADLLREALVLHADETPVAQLDPGAGKTKRAYLWAYRTGSLDTGPPLVVFDYQESRSGEHARHFLSGWTGHLMVDDFGGYKALFGDAVIELGCLAHARRKFFELHQANGSPLAEEALGRIGELYAIETQGQGLGVDERRDLRIREAKPRLEALFDWLLKTRATVAQGSGTAKAMDYTLKRRAALCRYAESGHLPIDNNAVENAIRPIAIGKKNWLFAGSARAGKRAAAIQSLIATARLNGLDPYAWLRDTLEKLPAWPYSRIDELLPIRVNAGS